MMKREQRRKRDFPAVCRTQTSRYTTLFIPVKGKERSGDGKGSRWEIFHDTEFRAQRLTQDGEQAMLEAKEWRAYTPKKRKEEKPEKHDFKYE